MFDKKRVIIFVLPLLIAIFILVFYAFFYESVKIKFGKPVAETVMIILVVLTILISLLNSYDTTRQDKSGMFFGSDKKAKNILDTGIKATAKVIYIGENSKGGIVTINEQPLLNLKLKIDDYKNPPYETSFDLIIPRYMVPQFQPGELFPVRIDPDDMDTVVLDDDSLNENLLYLTLKPEVTEYEKNRINEAGNYGMVRLIELSDTGKSENFKPVVKTVWEVLPEAGASYTLMLEKTLDIAVIDQLKKLINRNIDAKIHPDDKEIIRMDITNLQE